MAVTLFLPWVPICQGQRIIIQVPSVGENLTLNCYPPRNGYVRVFWNRTQSTCTNTTELLATASTSGLHHTEKTCCNDNRFCYNYTESWDATNSYLALTLMDADIINDSGNLICCFRSNSHIDQEEEVVRYDIRVIGCSCSKKWEKLKTIQCDLNGYTASRKQPIKVTVNGGLFKGKIKGTKLASKKGNEAPIRKVRYLILTLTQRQQFMTALIRMKR